MSMWLYQMNERFWASKLFRRTIWEGRHWKWNRGEIKPANAVPEPGDTLVFSYAKTNCDEPGIYGWGDH